MSQRWTLFWLAMWTTSNLLVTWSFRDVIAELRALETEVGVTIETGR